MEATIWKQGSGEFWRYLADQTYVAVECTGFAATTQNGHCVPTLSFQEACERGRNNLENMAHLATLDVVRLQKGRGFSAYEPPLASVSFATKMAALGMPTPPPILLTLRTECDEIKGSFLSDVGASTDGGELRRCVALWGMGGVGKTVLAAALARDENVKGTFPDGVFWIHLGARPNLPVRLYDVARLLGDEPRGLRGRGGERPRWPQVFRSL